MNFKKNTMMKVSKEVTNDLKEIGKKSETYDDIIRRLIMFYRKKNGEISLQEKVLRSIKS